MKILGFNINISRSHPPTLKRSTSLSPGMDWLTGGSGEHSAAGVVDGSVDEDPKQNWLLLFPGLFEPFD